MMTKTVCHGIEKGKREENKSSRLSSQNLLVDCFDDYCEN